MPSQRLDIRPLFHENLRYTVCIIAIIVIFYSVLHAEWNQFRNMQRSVLLALYQASSNSNEIVQELEQFYGIELMNS